MSIVISMKFSPLLLIVTLVLLNCQFNENKEARAFFCDKLDLSDAKVGNIPFVNSKEYVYNKFGKPSSIRDSCASTSVLYKQGYHHYTCLLYDELNGVEFKLIDDTIFVFRINFKETTLPVIIEDKEYSQNTTLVELVKDCAYLQKRINAGASSAVYDKQDWIYIGETEDKSRKAHRNVMEMRFEKGKLVYLEYDWQPAYTEQEWEQYLSDKQELEENGYIDMNR